MRVEHRQQQHGQHPGRAVTAETPPDRRHRGRDQGHDRRQQAHRRGAPVVQELQAGHEPDSVQEDEDGEPAERDRLDHPRAPGKPYGRHQHDQAEQAASEHSGVVVQEQVHAGVEHAGQAGQAEHRGQGAHDGDRDGQGGDRDHRHGQRVEPAAPDLRVVGGLGRRPAVAPPQQEAYERGDREQRDQGGNERGERVVVRPRTQRSGDDQPGEGDGEARPEHAEPDRRGGSSLRAGDDDLGGCAARHHHRRKDQRLQADQGALQGDRAQVHVPTETTGGQEPRQHGRAEQQARDDDQLPPGVGTPGADERKHDQREVEGDRHDGEQRVDPQPGGEEEDGCRAEQQQGEPQPPGGTQRGGSGQDEGEQHPGEQQRHREGGQRGSGAG